jgi:hypothetical protein
LGIDTRVNQRLATKFDVQAHFVAQFVVETAAAQRQQEAPEHDTDSVP